MFSSDTQKSIKIKSETGINRVFMKLNNWELFLNWNKTVLTAFSIRSVPVFSINKIKILIVMKILAGVIIAKRYLG